MDDCNRDVIVDNNKASGKICLSWLNKNSRIKICMSLSVDHSWR